MTAIVNPPTDSSRSDERRPREARLVSPSEAAGVVHSGDRVGFGWGPNEPSTLVSALANRADELRDVVICDLLGGAAMQPLLAESVQDSFRAWTSYIGEPLRPAVRERRADYFPSSYGILHQHGVRGRFDARAFDVYMVKVSPPDQNGYCSFGRALWLHKFSALRSTVVIGELDPGFIRTGGDNFIHVSAFDYLVEPRAEDHPENPMAGLGGGSEVDQRRLQTIDVIGDYFASLVRDGDTLQFGAGAVSSMMPPKLLGKRDLGIHSEGVPQSVLDLVHAGVITGRKKTLHRNKIVGSVFGIVESDLPQIADNPMWELYDINYVDNPLVIASHDNFVAVNTCLEIDLTGQANAESFGSTMYSGPGGQPDFVMGAVLSSGGRSIHVMQSSARGGTVSTIVPALAAGTGVTVSRNYIDFVVTEFGIAALQGKTLRERSHALIAIAHPDFRGELTRSANALFG